jgi:pimeloyl-ACP methyl ester carboxylesterase
MPRYDTELGAVISDTGTPIHLRPQSLDVLRSLARCRGRVVSKEDLLRDVWGRAPVTDDVIYQCIRDIRHAFGEDGKSAIRTVSRKGYVLREDACTAGGPFSGRELHDAGPVAYATSRDGTRIAWTCSGSGLPVLKMPNFVTHIGRERRSLLYGPFYERLGRRARIVRFDQRGHGMSALHAPPLSLDRICEDALAVARAAGLGRFFIYGMSQGVSYGVEFARRHPEMVLGLLFRGGYARGRIAGGRDCNRRTFEAAMQLIEIGWDSDDPAFKRYFSARIAPDAPPEILDELDLIQKVASPLENMREHLRFTAHLDVSGSARQVRCPAILVHARGDLMVPLEDGRELADLLPQGELVVLEGRNHTLVPGTDAFERAVAAFEAFLDRHGALVPS